MNYTKWKLTVLGSMGAIYGLANPALSNFQSNPNDQESAIIARINKSWSCSRHVGGDTGIEIIVSDDGKIYEPRIVQSSGDPQHDAECLESICGTCFVDTSISNPTFRISHYTMYFNNDNGLFPAYKNDMGIQNYRLHHPTPSKPEFDYVLIHRIPLAVLTRYPGVFSEKELLDESNLVSIKCGRVDANGQSPHGEPSFSDFLALYYGPWRQFFQRKNATKDEILEHAKQNAQILQGQW